VESPTWLEIDEVFGTEMRTFFDCDFSSGSCVRPEEPFSSGDLTGNEFSYDIRTPWRLGGGLQYSMGGLTLAGDATFIDWTQAEISAEDASFSALNRNIQDLNTTINTRVGLEYEAEVFSVRTGVAFQPSPTDRTFEDIDGNTADGDRLFLSAGASIALGDKSSLNISWLQERFDDQFTSYSSESGSPTVREALRRNRVLIGITYRP
jgi:long-subunit fatty acid transport protein